jgi:ubiquitin carboxyl-terminal hydrolase 8
MTPLSVADRIKSLQANGLAVQTGALMASANAAKSRRPSNAPATAVNTTRSSRGSLSSHHGGLTSPMSPSFASTSSTREPVSPHSASSQTLFPSPPSPTQAPPTPQFVSLSSLGPPSPTSSAPPSPLPTPSDLPLLSKLVGAIGSPSPDFERAFPSLEEWEETLENGPGHSSYETAADQEQSHMPRHDQFVPSSSFQRSPVSPQAYQSPLPSLARRFSILSIDRPASTPPRPLPVPDSPTNETAAIPESAAPLAPREIYNLQQRRKEVLFLDLRSREKWDVERVKGDVVCVEPTFATHDLTADRLVSLLELSSSRQERAMFENRRQFSLVVIYEDEEPSEVSRAVAKALWDMEFRREVKLKRAPVLMSGGFRRWKDDVGDAGVSHGRERLRARTSEISLKSHGTGTGSGSGHEGGSVSRQVTGQKISPTSTANGWALPASSKHGSTSPGGSNAPSINGTPLPPPLQPRRKSSPHNDRHPTPSQPQPPPPSQGPSPSSYSEQQMDPSIRTEGSSPRPLPMPQPYPTSSPAPMPGSSSNISRDQFWVPPPSSREQDEVGRLSRKPALPRPPSSTHLPNSSFDHVSLSIFPRCTFIPSYSAQTYPHIPSSRHMSPPAPITYPTAPSRTLPPIQMPSPQHRSVPPQTHTPQPQLNGVVSPLPQASIRPLPLARRRSDYLDQPSQPQPVPPSYSPANTRHSLDYPSYPGQTIRPPPPAAGERYPRMPNGTASYTSPPIPTSTRPNGVPLALKPTSSMPNGQIVPSDYPVMYWSDYQVSTSGLKNLGNTCYMNSTIQCLSSVYPFAIYFSGKLKCVIKLGHVTDGFADGRFKNAINRTNAMSSKGEVALAFASLLHQMRQGDMVYLTPHEFRVSLTISG